jgi:hypothetical protein
MTITATFSNGYTDTYKGNRPVKAAWAIIDRNTGKVLHSGHSLDVIKARKTAEGNCRYHVAAGFRNGFDRPNRWAHANAYFGKKAREQGFRSWKEAYEAGQAKQAKWIAENLKIEVVEI